MNMASLDRVDSFRFPDLVGDVGALPRQEWQHFIVHGRDTRMIVNVSLADQPEGVAARLVVIVRRPGGLWSGWIDDHDESALSFGEGGASLALGESRVTLFAAGYELELRSSGAPVAGRLRFTPVSKPAIKHNTSLGAGRFTWLYVPRLVVDGYLHVDDIRYSMRKADGYHDHNWGRFDWSDDFGWTWGSAQGIHEDRPWSLLFWQMTDRGHLITQGRGISFEIDGDPPMMSRDARVSFRSRGLLRKAPALTLPAVSGITRGGSASDIPLELELEDHANGLRAVGRPREYCRLAVPGSDGPGAVVQEAAFDVELLVPIDGARRRLEGSGVLETVH